MKDPNQKSRKAIIEEAKTLIAQDKLREKATRTARRAENKHQPVSVRWQAFWAEVADNRALRKARRKQAKALEGVEKKNQKKILRKYKRIRFRWRRWLIFGLIVMLIVAILNLTVVFVHKANAKGSPEVETAREASRQMAQVVVGEGIVLLKNEDQLLPLETAKVNVYGSSSIKPAFGGGASGAVNNNYAIGFYESLEDAGIEYNRDLYNVYGNFVEKGHISTKTYTKPARPGVFQVLLPNLLSMFTPRPDELDVSQIPDEVVQSIRDYSDTALVYLSRGGVEAIEGGYADTRPEQLRLTELEEAMVDFAVENSEEVIIILNTGNAMELDWVDDPLYDGKIKSVLWIGMVGEVGLQSVTDALVGKVNPSGRLVDTYVKDVLNTTPAASNFGNYVYVDAEGEDTGRRFVNYDEGIYVGYRYFETRFGEDQTQYEKVVQYPFGYGLSYTTFSQKIANYPSFDEEGNIVVVVEVTNTGQSAGKEVVQLYSTPPYMPGGIEKASKNLVAFGKTALLEPGTNQFITLTINLADLASYNSQSGVQAWVVEDGTYLLTLGKNAHDAWETFTLEVSGVTKEQIPTNEGIRNLFAEVEQGLDLMTRADFEGTYPELKPQGTTAWIQDELLEGQTFTAPSGFDAQAVKSGQTGNRLIMLLDLQGKGLEDPLWQSFIEQFTVDEMINVIADMSYKVNGVERLGLPDLKALDGPAQLKEMLGTTASIAFPAANLAASTWNPDLVRQMAAHMSDEAVTLDVHIWYAPAVNMHRSALGGRNFEYFSEDPLIAGKMGAAYIQGAREKGLVVTVKHFALNEQESNRATYGVYTWATEQAMREIYLKAFEISVKEGQPYGVMTALNRVGPDWSSASKPLITDLLRNEWGFEGFVTSDATLSATGGYTQVSAALEAGNDGILSMFNAGGTKRDLKAAFESEPEYTIYLMQQAMRNICYMMLQTNAMGN